MCYHCTLTIIVKSWLFWSCVSHLYRTIGCISLLQACMVHIDTMKSDPQRKGFWFSSSSGEDYKKFYKKSPSSLPPPVSAWVLWTQCAIKAQCAFSDEGIKWDIEIPCKAKILWPVVVPLKSGFRPWDEKGTSAQAVWGCLFVWHSSDIWTQLFILKPLSQEFIGGPRKWNRPQGSQ